MNRVIATALWVVTAAGGSEAAEPPVVASGVRQVALIELFTSEGCSSCPPAERWLGELRDEPGLWKEFVPIAWHVIYWDRLGWRDRFAARQFTERQYDYAEAWRSDSVYTPCLVRNGAEWRSRRPGGAPAPEVGALRARYESGGSVHVEFHPTAALAAEDFVVHVALLGGGISSVVRAGENAGRTLMHDFVALAWTTTGLASRDDAGDDVRRATVTLDETAAPATPRRALAVWVTRRGGLAPVQAAGGWLK